MRPIIVSLAAFAAIAIPALLAWRSAADGGATDNAPAPGADPGSAGNDSPSFGSEASALLDGLGVTIRKAFTLPSRAAPYTEAVASAEISNGLPQGLLARVLYQESSFDPAIISGAKKSPVGATGIAQFMPATAADLGVDPTNPIASINAAGRYLAQLFARFGNWSEALAAYNWGQGNVAAKGIAKAPAETKNYVASILADVPVTS